MSNERPSILVTGATGLNGSAIIREFSRQKQPVRALVRNPAKARALALDASPFITFVEGDMTRPETLGAALEGIERILVISSAGPQMLDTQRKFIDVAKAAGVRHIVKFSGLNAASDSTFVSTRMHGEVEHHLENSGIAWTHLRPNAFMQFHYRDVPAIVGKDAFFLPLANATQSLVDVEDIAKVAFALLRDGGHEGKSYEMTGPEALSMRDVADQLSQATDRTIRYVDVTGENRSERLWWGHQGSPPFADAMDELFKQRRTGTESRVVLDAHEAFGIRPTIFAEFAQRNAAVFRGEIGVPANLSAIR
jgi:uncharacterized protein YbjT (DUF2867 family)